MSRDGALDLPVVAVPPRRAWVIGWWGLIRWSLIRHRYLLPAFTAVQALFAVAVVYGLALLVPEVDTESARHLSAGAWTLGVIAVGCVLAPQIVTTAKQEGLLAYQRTLPVPRSAIPLADAVVWIMAALPGIAVGVGAAALRFGLTPRVDALTIAALLAVALTATGIGLALAYLLSANATGLVTQIIMIGGLLFSPITFPAERLPDWAAALHQVLPFAPMGDLVREAAFRVGEPQTLNIVVVALWMVGTHALAYAALRRRG